MNIIPQNTEDCNFIDFASNGCGVAQTLASVYKEVMRETKSTDETNSHPAVKFYLQKLCDLAGIQLADDQYFKIYCELSKTFPREN